MAQEHIKTFKKLPQHNEMAIKLAAYWIFHISKKKIIQNDCYRSDLITSTQYSSKSYTAN